MFASPAGLLLALLRPEPGRLLGVQRPVHAAPTTRLYTAPTRPPWQHPCAAAAGRGCPTDPHPPRSTTKQAHRGGVRRRAPGTHAPGAVSVHVVACVCCPRRLCSLSSEGRVLIHPPLGWEYCCIVALLQWVAPWLVLDAPRLVPGRVRQTGWLCCGA